MKCTDTVGAFGWLRSWSVGAIDAAESLLSDAFIRPIVYDLLSELVLGSCQLMLTARGPSTSSRTLMRELPTEWNLIADVLSPSVEQSQGVVRSLKRDAIDRF
ncbi:MAG: hypothetical protein M3046_08710 [Actinomycetota bacterium]|nr:hypothetical protein [Actinomycetota bacterium]